MDLIPLILTLREKGLPDSLKSVCYPSFAGEGARGTIFKDKDGQVLGNLDDLKPEEAAAIKFIYYLKSPMPRSGRQ
ncbi:MAG: hypothetical protein ACHBNF_18640 [Chromatiales bacterium]